MAKPPLGVMFEWHLFAIIIILEALHELWRRPTDTAAETLFELTVSQ